MVSRCGLIQADVLGQENKQVTKANLWNSVVCIVYTAEFAKGKVRRSI